MVHWKYPGSLNDCQSGPNTTRARQKIVLAWGSFPNLNFEPKFFVEVFRSNTHILNTEASVLVYYFNFITRASAQAPDRSTHCPTLCPTLRQTHRPPPAHRMRCPWTRHPRTCLPRMSFDIVHTIKVVVFTQFFLDLNFSKIDFTINLYE